MECILNIDKLRRGKILVNKCYFCKRAEESCNHVLLWCPVVTKLLSMIFNNLGISWVVSGSVKKCGLGWG